MLQNITLIFTSPLDHFRTSRRRNTRLPSLPRSCPFYLSKNFIKKYCYFNIYFNLTKSNTSHLEVMFASVRQRRQRRFGAFYQKKKTPHHRKMGMLLYRNLKACLNMRWKRRNFIFQIT